MSRLSANAKDRVFESLLSSSLPILRGKPYSPLDGALYDGPTSVTDIATYESRLNVILNESQASKIVGFKIQELRLENKNTEEGRMIRVSTPHDPAYDSVEFYILAYGFTSWVGSQPIYENEAFEPDFSSVAVVPRAVARHFQTYEKEFVTPYNMHISMFPPALHPFMVELDLLPAALQSLMKTAQEAGSVYESPQLGVRFTGWKVHFVDQITGLLDGGEDEPPVPNRARGSGGEHYFRYGNA